MKKLLTVLLTLFMVFTLVGCNSKEDTPVVQEPEKQEIVEETKEEPEIVGGYVDAEDGTLTDELKDIFDSALEDLLGATYEPQELVATQVVAGTNYKFLANGTKTTNPITKGTYYITIYKDLQGNVSLLDIETIEEKQEETSQTKKDILKTYNYWVVFYDQYGNELQREALKYGTVPEYKSWLPEGFDKWVYKKSGKDVGSFKSITGNTYYQAVCHEVYHSSSTPAPTPVTYTVTYNANGATSGTAPDAQTKVKDEDLTLSANTRNLKMTGHTFIGWNTESDGTGTHYAENGSYTLNEDIILYADWDPPACLAKGTLITMADGTRRLIETLSEGDLIRVFNHDTGKVSSAKIMDYWQYEEKKSGLITLHFTNCIDVNIVTAHGFYNKEENKYVVLDANNINSYIGKHFYNVDNNSWETLLSATYSNEKVDTFFIATEGQFDTVAEGMLNVEDGIYYVLRNTFDFDENMKVDQIKKINDINKYGLFNKGDFKYSTDEAIEKYGLAYLKVAIGKGIITESDLDVIREECASYESENIVEEYIPENVQHSVR